MSKPEILKKLDAALTAEQDVSQKLAAQTSISDRRARDFVTEARPVLESFRQEFEPRGIRVEVKSGAASFSVKLMYIAGGYTGFEFNTKKGWPEYFGLHAEGRARHISEGGAHNEMDACTISALEDRIQDAIDSYMARAWANGGLPKKPSDILSD